MAGEKDTLGDKLHDLESARENQWAAQRDRELLEKLRRKGGRLQVVTQAIQKNERHGSALGRLIENEVILT